MLAIILCALAAIVCGFAGRRSLVAGLGGGGTSMPYFLQSRVQNVVLMENEYARIMLEQGVPGLLLWVAFVVWVLTRRPRLDGTGWAIGRRMAWYVVASSFLLGVIGSGMLTSIPQTCLLLLSAGWIAVRPAAPRHAGYAYSYADAYSDVPADAGELVGAR